jgi:hypothetical protein
VGFFAACVASAHKEITKKRNLASQEYREQYFNTIDNKEVNQQLNLARPDLGP